MPSVFISYRREDTAGAAGRLAEGLIHRFGRANIFIDIDTIAPGADFEERIQRALASCQVALVLIGDRWLTAALPDGTRRLDADGDYVRSEIAAALARPGVTVLPVLVEGVKMPSADQLPADIAALTKINAFELSNRRWRIDLRELTRVVERYDRSWRRVLRWRPRWATRAALAFVVAGAISAVVILATSGSAGVRSSASSRAILVPATVPPAVNECTTQLQFGADGTAGPLKCSNGDLNTLAWQYYAKFNLLVMTLGPSATPGEVHNAVCADQRNNPNQPQLIRESAAQIALIYYGWRFAAIPTGC